MADTDIIREGLHFGEGPRWHDGRLWYSDFYDHAVHALDESGRDERVLALPLDGQPSGLGWLPDGRLLVVSMLDRRVLRREHDGSVTEHADLSGLERYQSNDMVVDGDGRAIVGGFGFDLDGLLATHGAAGLADPGPTPTVLIRVDPDGTATVAAQEMLFPNGAVILDDQRVLVVAETLAARLTAFRMASDGSLTDRRVWADLSGARIAPDGICLDRDGAIWVANALAPACVRVAEGGEVLDSVDLSQNCYACALGGSDGRTLFALTAPSSTAEVAAASPRGRIEAVRVTVPA